MVIRRSVFSLFLFLFREVFFYGAALDLFLVDFGSCGALDLNYREDKLVKLEEEEESYGDKNADEEAGFGAEEAHYLAEAAYLDVVPLTDDVAAVDVVAVVEVVGVTAGNETFCAIFVDNLLDSMGVFNLFAVDYRPKRNYVAFFE